MKKLITTFVFFFIIIIIPSSVLAFNYDSSLNGFGYNNLVPDDVQYYGEMWFHNDTTPGVIEINASEEWYLFTVFEDGFYQELGFVNEGSVLVANNQGKYKIDYCTSVNDGVNNKYHFAIGINNEEQLNTEQHFRVSTGGDIVSVCGSGIIDINYGDEIGLLTLNENSNTDLNVYSANLNLVKIMT